MKCRHCNSDLQLTFIDLGSAPPSNAYLTAKTLHAPEKWYPLRVLVCESCWLVQTEDFTQADELFDAQYAYFSGFSQSWLKHSEYYVTDMIERFQLNENSHVVEVAANDGYLLQYVKERNIPCTGIEPTTSTANSAREKGIDIVEDFFGINLSLQLVMAGKQADLMAANNVLAHVPDINDFVAGFTLLLKPNGVATFEFPHLYNLVKYNQFDTIYHEHFSYLSLTSVKQIFAKNGLQIFDVEEYLTHGGSLRVFAQRADTGIRSISPNVTKVLQHEEEAGIKTTSYYNNFQYITDQIKNKFLRFLIEAKCQGKNVAAYGAAAKGNTFMNYAGVRPDLISFVVDRNPSKQNKYMPGSRIPIVDEQQLRISQPDYVVILPWNLKSEIMVQLEYIRKWGGKFLIAVPNMEVV